MKNSVGPKMPAALMRSSSVAPRLTAVLKRNAKLKHEPRMSISNG
jgi:hypothetical protein